jgi:hypothetical protein
MINKNEIITTRALQNFIDQNLYPNVYAVGTLKQGIQTRTHGYFLGGKYVFNRIWTKGSREIYAKEYHEFIKRLSKRYCKKAYKRYKRLFANAATLEGGDEGMRYHINMMFRCPSSVDFIDFEKTLRELWTDGTWMLSDIKIEERTGDCVGYSLKTGSDALLLESMSF